MPEVTVQQVFALALQHHQAGRLGDAEALYRQILTVQPAHAEALHHLGLVAHQAGRYERAVEWIRQSTVLAPDNYAAHSNLGEAYRMHGVLDEAIASYRRALQLQSDQPEIHDNLGLAFAAQGRWEESAAAYRRALQLRPHYPEAYYNLGTLLAGHGQLDEAMAAFRRALELRPSYSQAWTNLGGALTEQGRWDEAVAVFRQALAIKPDALTYYNLGNALRARGQLDEAAAAYRHALRLQPDYALASYNLGNLFMDQDRLDEAVLAFEQALQSKSDYAAASYNLGIVLAERGQNDEAVAAFRRTLEIQPDQPDVHSNLIYKLHLHPGEDESIAAEHQRWNRQFAESLRRLIRPSANNRDPRRRLKIGYVSPSFHSTAAAFFLAPLLEAHDHERFEIYCYASVRRPDAVTRKLRSTADVWRDIRACTDAQVAATVQEDGIDILVDLMMHTADNRLPVFARKPAPVQVSWLAYPGSTGLETIDYRLSDAHLDPPGQEEAGLGEKVIRLPDSWCCYAPIEEFPPVGPLPAAQKEAVTFGSLNRFDKIHEGLLHRWAQLLAAVPQSRLLMICPQGQTRERTHALFSAHGIARERLDLVAPRPWSEYIRLCEGIDIALDPSPCNGMTTTCHALWMGLPVVTLTGTRAVSRAGDSLLHTIGLPEWVAKSEDEYIRIAAAWAADLPRLAALRAELRPRLQSSPLMDAPRFARNVEAAYRLMWEKWCAAPVEKTSPGER